MAYILHLNYFACGWCNHFVHCLLACLLFTFGVDRWFCADRIDTMTKVGGNLKLLIDWTLRLLPLEKMAQKEGKMRELLPGRETTRMLALRPKLRCGCSFQAMLRQCSVSRYFSTGGRQFWFCLEQNKLVCSQLTSCHRHRT